VDRPVPAADPASLLGGPLAWLADHAHENLGTEVALRGVIAGGGGRAFVTRRSGTVTGVAVARPGGPCFFEAAAPDAATALLERDGAVAAVIKRTADTARYATVGGTFTVPVRRGQGLARRLTAFMVSALLAERPAVTVTLAG
jgi:hypothetical protein